MLKPKAFAIMIGISYLVMLPLHANAQGQPDLLPRVVLNYSGSNPHLTGLTGMINAVVTDCVTTGRFDRRALSQVKAAFQEATEARVFTSTEEAMIAGDIYVRIWELENRGCTLR